MKNFEGFGLSEDVNTSLTRMKYTMPTPIQEKSIPLAMAGRDILGSAQTGTGKTAAFSIPLVEALLASPERAALVLTPTRELAKQVLEVIHDILGPKSGINTAFIIGGESMGKQFSQLRNNPRIIVGTPGRINDHLERGSMKLNSTDFLVLDETDRMLDMGFGIQLDKIFKFLPKKRQTLMFSATLPDAIVKMSGKYLTNPERVSVGATNVVAVNIDQEVIRINQEHKYKELVSQLYDRNGSVIIFVKTKHGTERMAKNLRRDGFEADALHGDLRQNKRTTVMNKFRNKKFRILVATDIAARGLDVPHIEHVINHDLPQVAEDYIHRMGRTARGGATGSALCFVSPEDGRKWRAIEILLDPSKKTRSNDNGGKGRPGKKKPFVGGRPAGKPSGGKSYAGKKSRTDRSASWSKDRTEGRDDKKKSFAGKPHSEKTVHGGKKSYVSKPSAGKPSHGKPSAGKSASVKRAGGDERPRRGGGHSKPRGRTAA